MTISAEESIAEEDEENEISLSRNRLREEVVGPLDVITDDVCSEDVIVEDVIASTDVIELVVNGLE